MAKLTTGPPTLSPLNQVSEEPGKGALTKLQNEECSLKFSLVFTSHFRCHVRVVLALGRPVWSCDIVSWCLCVGALEIKKTAATSAED